MPTRFTRVHFSSPVSSMCLQAKRPPGDTRWRLPEVPRSTRRPVQQRSGLATRKRRAVTSDRGNRPRDRAELTMHRSWWTLVYARSGNRLHSVQPCGSPRARLGRLLDGFLPLPRREIASVLSQSTCGCEASRRFRSSRAMQRGADARVHEARKQVSSRDVQKFED